MADKIEQWVDGPTAVAILDVADVRAVYRLVGEGLIGVRTLPGTRKRFRRDDCEQLARLSVRADSPSTNPTT